MRLTKGNLGKLTLPVGKSEALIFDEDLPGFGLRIRAGGKRTWVAQYRIGTKQRRITLGTPETVEPDEARRRAKEALAKVSLGGDPQSDKHAARASAAVTLGAIVPNYLAHAANHQSANYHADVKRYLEVHWAPLAEMAVAKIDRARVSMQLGELSKVRGAHSADRARAALSSLFGWAIGEGLAHANPTADTNRPIQPETRDRVLTDAELALVWRCAGAGDYGFIVQLLTLTGCRREEVGAMAWSELQGSMWTIPGRRTKNGLPLELPLPPSTMAILGGVTRRDDRDLIFGARTGPFSGWSKAKAELDARMLAEVKAERGSKAALVPWRHHDLRRTAATRMGDLGVKPHVVEAVLNHISGSKAGVAGIYNRAAYRDEKRAALALWANRVKLVVAGVEP
ncbi:DUF4102 domain-containing protein [Lichenibacterium minor]|uniref:DUF4102 domain-containing protein n=1 Tax=Lichenibacterium minor TaxID=2316528 RepID=A0A4Q2TYY4_9HYPH|nr:integrase arm-type DNA-binding domain-containing protein [Lichenibacterium minor]RYC29339.1 DUF4102 domain-containing protein [Lichenibacterium minor]